mmetsp:Transcript_67631/g.119974  ORF Transcript_67631/g.119974 Transcript_67631/m.119974 type:complete len:90 (+) Transcript_67631:1687-1956(+)
MGFPSSLKPTSATAYVSHCSCPSRENQHRSQIRIIVCPGQTQTLFCECDSEERSRASHCWVDRHGASSIVPSVRAASAPLELNLQLLGW